MSELYVEVKDGTTPVPVPPSIDIVPQRFSARARGGPDRADLQATGPRHMLWQLLLWLGYDLTIYNVEQRALWWGEIEEVAITLGSQTVGLSLKRLVNRVQVVYTDLGADGAPEQFTTDWNSDSQSTNQFGTRSARITLPDVSQEVAEVRRDSVLEALAKPLATITSDESTSVFATVHCAGYWYRLKDYYYSNTAGKEEFTTGGSDQVMGVGFTSSSVGFNASNRWIFGMGDGAFLAGSKLVVSGSGSNNGTFTVHNLGDQEDESYTANTISFSAPNDIEDSANGLGNFFEDDVVQIAGTTSNNGIYKLDDAGVDAIEVDEDVIVNESAGTNFTIERKDYVTVEESVTEEDAGTSITVTAYGEKVAQQFTQEVNADWTVAKIAIRIKRVGSPGDNVKVALYSDSATAPDTELDSGTVAGTDIGTSMAWIEFDLNNTDTISHGTDYWIVVSRTGSNSATNYYVVDVDEDLGYTLGVFRVWDGSSWVARPTVADMPFRILGAVETTTQIASIVAESTVLAGTDTIDESNVETNQYQDGNSYALDIVERLLDSGTSGNRRLLAEVTVEKILRLREQPAAASDENELFWDADGRLRDKSGRHYPLGFLPAGEWVTLTEVPSAIGQWAAISPFFVEMAEYDAIAQRWYLEAEGTPDLWQLGEGEIG